MNSGENLFAELRSLLEQAHLCAATDDYSNARTKVLEAVKVVRSLDSSAHLRSLSKFVLHCHDLITNKSLSLSTRLQWTASHLTHTCICYPIIEFGPGLSSHDPIFADSRRWHDPDPQLARFPHGDKIEFVARNDADQFLPSSTEADDNWICGPEVADLLVQDLTTDCSIILAMISIASNRRAPQISKLVSPPKFIWPQYSVKLLFNGHWRLVTIDNTLPALLHGRSWHVRANTPWPALLEKAMLKVFGEGYAFDGSNMALDTYMMTGWVPEIISLASEPQAGNLIRKCLQQRDQGQALVGMGTGSISEGLSSKLRIVPDHDYYIVDYNFKDETATLRNPWRQGSDLWENAPLLFIRQMYVNWNPARWQYSHKIDCVALAAETLLQCPQYTLTNPDSEPRQVYLLLERHLPRVRGIPMHMMVYHTGRGERVWGPGQYSCEQIPSTTLRIQTVQVLVPPLTLYTIAILSPHRGQVLLSMFYDGQQQSFLTRAKCLYSTVLAPITGEWRGASAGGSHHCPTFTDNPQYTLTVKQPVNIQLVLVSEGTERVALHMIAEPESAYQLTSYTSDANDKYTVTMCERRIQLFPGQYRIIVAQETPQLCNKFRIHANHDGLDTAVALVKVSARLDLYTWDTIVETGTPQFTIFTQEHNQKVTIRIRSEHGTIMPLPNLFGADNFTVETSIYGCVVRALAANPSTLIVALPIRTGRVHVTVASSMQFRSS